MTTSRTDYPVTYDVEMQLEGRNQVTCAFRIILAIPHIILVGGPGGVGIGLPGFIFGGGNLRVTGVIGNGALAAVAGVMAIISWFAIVFTGSQPRGLFDFTSFYLRWRSKAIAYTALLRDEYPPFGDGAYPVQFSPGEFPATRDRWSVGLRFLYLIPHLIVLFFLGIAWLITAIIGWFSLVFTATYPEALYRFAIGFLRWSLRVEAYALLMSDEFPPFSFD